MPLKDAEAMYLILALRRGVFAGLHECFGDKLSHLYIQEYGFVPTFSSDSSSANTMETFPVSYLADKYRNISFPEGNSLWPWVLWLAGITSLCRSATAFPH